ncbi:hypothetical protein J6590_107424, partial [Homalodisca vitripennis]
CSKRHRCFLAFSTFGGQWSTLSYLSPGIMFTRYFFFLRVGVLFGDIDEGLPLFFESHHPLAMRVLATDDLKDNKSIFPSTDFV